MTMDKVEDLLARGEHQHLDFKGPMSFSGSARLELARDLVAMANTRDGGTIVVGVSEDANNGGWRCDGVTSVQARSFDVTKICDFVGQRFAPPIRLHTRSEKIGESLVVLLQVPGFSDQPLVCTKDGATETGKVVFRQGDLIVRTPGAKSEKVCTEAAMRELLNAAVQRRADTILQDLARLMKGAPRGRAVQEPFWTTAQTIAQRHTPRKGEFERLGSRSFVLVPSDPIELPDGMPPHSALRDGLQDSIVSVRGWDFPHASREDLKNRKDPESGLIFLHADTAWTDHVEAMSVFESGYFRYERIAREDLESRNTFGIPEPWPPGKYLNWLETTYSVGEFLLFAARFCVAFNLRESVTYEMRLSGIGGRLLRSRAPGRELRKHRCSEDEIVVRRTVTTAALQGDIVAAAVDALKDIFVLFEWADASEAMLAGDIKKLFDRRL